MHEMHEKMGKRRDLGHLPSDLEKNKAENLMGGGILVRRRFLGWERNERDRDIWKDTKSGRTSEVYIKNATQ